MPKKEHGHNSHADEITNVEADVQVEASLEVDAQAEGEFTHPHHHGHHHRGRHHRHGHHHRGHHHHHHDHNHDHDHDHNHDHDHDHNHDHDHDHDHNHDHHHDHEHHHGHGPHFTGDTVNLIVSAVNRNLVTEVQTNSELNDIGFEIVPGVTSFTDANSGLYLQGFRLVASINDEDGDGAIFIYVR